MFFCLSLATLYIYCCCCLLILKTGVSKFKLIIFFNVNVIFIFAMTYMKNNG